MPATLTGTPIDYDVDWCYECDQPLEDCACCLDCGSYPCVCNACAECDCDCAGCDCEYRYCPRCDCGVDGSDDDYDGYTGLHSWNYRPDLHFNGTGPAFYGMEIEVTADPVSRLLTVVNAADPDERLLYVKSDASVYGGEIVTHPMSFDWARAEFPWEMLAELKKRGCDVIPRSNGIHVHVSRDAFRSPAHLYRWLKFWYRNPEPITAIAGRDSTWGKFSPDHRKGQLAHVLKDKPHPSLPRLSRLEAAERGAYRVYMDAAAQYQRERERHTWDDGHPAVRRAHAAYADAVTVHARATLAVRDATGSRLADTTRADRYSAINTQNDDTLEVRVFASTLRPEVAQARLGLVAGTVEYTRNLTAHDITEGGWEFGEFRSWLSGHGEYSALREHIDTQSM